MTVWWILNTSRYHSPHWLAPETWRITFLEANRFLPMVVNKKPALLSILWTYKVRATDSVLKHQVTAMFASRQALRTCDCRHPYIQMFFSKPVRDNWLKFNKNCFFFKALSLHTLLDPFFFLSFLWCHFLEKQHGIILYITLKIFCTTYYYKNNILYINNFLNYSNREKLIKF